jgi:hypothetical protein
MFTKNHIRQLVYNLEILSINCEHAHEDNVVWICDFRGWTIASTLIWESNSELLSCE